MSTDLFPVEPSLHPRLAWLERNGLTLTKLPSGRYEVTLNDETRATGDDPDEAVVNFCVKTGLRHYAFET